MYDSHEEAKMRLEGTVISGPKGPIYVREIQGKNSMVYSNFSKEDVGLSRNLHACKINDPNFSIKPFRLGFINYKGEAIYTQRMPCRKYKQGLSEISFYHRADRPTTEVLFSGRAFVDMYKGKYPDIKTCYGSIQMGVVLSTAFHREWALSRGGKDRKNVEVLYKHHLVGKIDDNLSIELIRDFEYLTEALKEAMS